MDYAPNVDGICCSPRSAGRCCASACRARLLIVGIRPGAPGGRRWRSRPGIDVTARARDAAWFDAQRRVAPTAARARRAETRWLEAMSMGLRWC